MAVEITGKIVIDGVETEFIMHADHGNWSQWGGTIDQLAQRVDYLQAITRGLEEHSDYYNQQEEDEEDAAVPYDGLDFDDTGEDGLTFTRH